MKNKIIGASLGWGRIRSTAPPATYCSIIHICHIASNDTFNFVHQGLRHEIFIPSFFPSYFIIIKYYSLPFGIDPHCIFIFTTINNRFQLNDTLHTVWQKCAIAPVEPRCLCRGSARKKIFSFFDREEELRSNTFQGRNDRTTKNGTLSTISVEFKPMSNDIIEHKESFERDKYEPRS